MNIQSLRIAIAIVILFVIIFVCRSVVCNKTDRTLSQYLAGMWVGDPTFLKEAKLKDFQLYISPGHKYTHSGYLVMVDEAGQFVSNQSISLHTSGFKKSSDLYKTSAEIGFSEHNPSIPDEINIRISCAKGSLILSDDQKIYACLWKDHIASAAAEEAWNSTAH
jgi:hypothetical protein